MFQQELCLAVLCLLSSDSFTTDEVMHVPQINLAFAWCWIVVGFLSGMVQGLSFHREDWLGGYASFRRRLYRLAHISFFGLGAVNLFFYLTFSSRTDSSGPLT